MWELALAADSSLSDARERLAKANASLDPMKKTAGRTSFPVTPAEELGKLRTVGVPALPKREGSAEYFVLLANHQVLDAEFISGSDNLKAASAALKAANFSTELPGDPDVKLVRRGILACSRYTAPSCQFVMLLPSSTHQ